MPPCSLRRDGRRVPFQHTTVPSHSDNLRVRCPPLALPFTKATPAPFSAPRDPGTCTPVDGILDAGDPSVDHPIGKSGLDNLAVPLALQFLIELPAQHSHVGRQQARAGRYSQGVEECAVARSEQCREGGVGRKLLLAPFVIAAASANAANSALVPLPHLVGQLPPPRPDRPEREAKDRLLVHRRSLQATAAAAPLREGAPQSKRG
mmetsp:Transcript_7769/g.22852  ORF Transcript_7769/g.22852 Transcript_7769/m.22852 type:complete len:206 (-) Transcript_7769:906-1523(-)